MPFVPWVATVGTAPPPLPVSLGGTGATTVLAWPSALLAPSGTVAETFPRLLGLNSVQPTTGLVQFQPVALLAGQVVTNLVAVTGSAAGGAPTHGWYALLDSTGKVLAVSADQASGWQAVDTEFPLAMGSPFTVTTTGLYYTALSITAAVECNLVCLGTYRGSAAGQVTKLAGTAGTVNAPPAVGSTLTLTATTNVSPLYMFAT